MKITVNIDCTPIEARLAMGLPDVKPIQDEMMEEMRERMMAAATAMDPTEMMRTFMAGGNAAQQMQEMFARMAGFGTNQKD